jgi:hypothetical protein
MRTFGYTWGITVLLFSRAVQGEDCNGNISDDRNDIENGSSRDCNANGVPDECDLLPSYPAWQYRHFGALRPVSVEVVDLDGDGMPEALTANAESDNICVLRNDGSGGLVLTQYLAAGDGPWRVRSGDFDADGDPDVAVANLESDDISIFQNHAGDLVADAPLPTGDRPFHLIVADVSGDGLVDMVTVNSMSDDVTILLGAGGGGFTTLTVVSPAQGFSALCLAAGDIDRDGDTDLLTATPETGTQGFPGHVPGKLWVIPNLGEGTFGTPSDLAFGPTPLGLAVGDLDGDDLIDIAAATEGRRVAVLWGTGAGSFAEPAYLAIGKTAREIQAIDLDLDDDLDVCVSEREGLSCLINEGERNLVERVQDPSINAFAVGDVDGAQGLDLVGVDEGGCCQYRDAAVVLILDVPGASGPGQRLSLTVDADHVTDADFNGDGRSDLATSSSTTGRFSILLNDGIGNYPFPSAVHYATHGFPASCNSGDMDGDGAADIVIPHEEDASIHVYRNDGHGRFFHADAISLDLPASRASPWDFDSDGDLDLACASHRRRSVLLLRNDGEAGFAVETVKEFQDGARSVLAADLDSDGQAEIALDGYDQVVIFSWAPTTGLHEVGGSFLPMPVLEAADIDSDGRLDLVGGHPRGMAIRRNLGNLTFDRGLVTNWSTSTLTAAIADVDGDGPLEFIGVDISSSRLFTKAMASAAYSMDLDGNGAPDECDLVRGDCDDNGVLDVEEVAAGQATDCNGNFVPDGCDLRPSIGLSPALHFDVGWNPYGLVAADLNADGHMDAATANTSSHHVSVLLSDRSLTFRPARSYPILASAPGQSGAASPRAIVAADLDQDGSVDLAVANQGRYSISELGGSISILWNQGNGTFFPGPYMPLVGIPVGVAMADLDGDSDVDLAAPHDVAGGVSILSNEGSRRFAPALELDVPTPASLGIGDLEGDGDQDLVFPSRSNGVLCSVRNAGDGQFEAPETTPLSSSNLSGAFHIADLDGDDRVDAMVGLGSYIHVYVNDGGGALALQEERLFAVQPIALDASDLDGDGDLDAIASQSTGSILVRPNLGSGGFGPGAEFACGKHPLWIATADIDGREGHDVLVAVGEHEDGGDTVAVMLNISGWSTDCDANMVPDECDIASGVLHDVNGDGFPDECVQRLGFGTQPVPPTTFHRGDVTGEGSFNITDPISLLNALFVDGHRLSCREAADFDNDGRINITDAIGGLGHLFLGTEPPAPPGPIGVACGVDPDPQGSFGDLGCDAYGGCRDRSPE